MGILGVGSEQEGSLVGQTVAGKFEIESLLGSGSMGRVYRARHIQLEQKVALKVMSAEFAGEKSLVARFEREAKASFAVAHPNIIRVIDYGKDTTGLVYLAMEFVDGGDLAGLIFRAAPLQKARIAHLMRQALAGVAAAHDAGIVHRDLKPENLMIATVIGDDGHDTEVVKVCDFGIAKLNDIHPSSERLERGRRRLTEIGLIIGTPEYMPPEQARGEKVDARSDIYALGVVLYELLTGTLPFVANTPTETIIKQISEEPARPSAGRTGVDPRLEEICLRALKKRAEDRFQTAREMRAALGFAMGMRESMEELPPHVEAPAPAPAPVSVGAPKSTLISSRAFPVNPPPTSQVPTQVPIVTAHEPPVAGASRARTAYAVGAVLVVAAGAAVVARLGTAHSEPQTAVVTEETTKTPTGGPPGLPTANPPVAANSPGVASPGAPAPATATPGATTSTTVTTPVGGAVAKPGVAAVAPIVARVPSKGAPSTTGAASDPSPNVALVPPPSAEPPVVAAAPPPPAVAVVPPPAPTPVPSPVQAAQAPPPPAPVDPSAARAVVSGIDNVQGALKRDVDKALSRASAHFVECYQADVRAAAVPVAGSGTLHIETDDSGTITSAHAAGPLSAAGARCLERSVVGVKVPNVDTGQASADVSISFSLR